ncbi:MAG: hypothetical protein HGA85_05085, partial [Nanoarchaeota archaeon]|nr:hypothetical protein [Nanoarchaeota archaeon]
MPHALQSQDIMEGLDYLAQRLSLMPLTCTEEPERKEYPDGIGITITRPDFSLSKVIPIEDGLFNIFFMSYSREKRQGYAGYEFNI